MVVRTSMRDYDLIVTCLKPILNITSPFDSLPDSVASIHKLCLVTQGLANRIAPLQKTPQQQDNLALT